MSGLVLSDPYHQNVGRYTTYRLFHSLIIIGPVLTPYLLGKGLNYTQILTLQGIAAVSVVVFEIPTGAVADKVSRKLSLTLSTLLHAIAMIIYICATDFLYHLAVAEALFGLGSTFGSGADSAILYESLDRTGRKNDCTRVEGRAASLSFAGQAIGCVASNWLYVIDPDLPFAFSVVFMLVSTAAGLLLHEPQREKSAHTSEHPFQRFGVRPLSCGPSDLRPRWDSSIGPVSGSTNLTSNSTTYRSPGMARSSSSITSSPYSSPASGDASPDNDTPC